LKGKYAARAKLALFGLWTLCLSLPISARMGQIIAVTIRITDPALSL